MQIVIALVFVSTVLFVLAVAAVVGPRPARRRLARLADGTHARLPEPSSEGTLLAADGQGWLSRLLGILGGSSGGETSKAGPLRERLIHAGYREDSAVAVYTGSRIVLALVLPMLVLLSPAVWHLDQWRLLPILAAAAGFGYVAPGWWVDRHRRRRQGAIERGLPDALDMMVVCVEAGIGINASLARVSGEFAKSNPILSTELEMVTLEIRAGKATTEALRGLADRTGVSDVSSLVSLLIQTERFGTSVADALRVHADAMRVRRMQRAEEQAGKAPLKMIFPTVLIFMATMIVILTPAVIRFAGIFEKQ